MYKVNQRQCEYNFNRFTLVILIVGVLHRRHWIVCNICIANSNVYFFRYGGEPYVYWAALWSILGSLKKGRQGWELCSAAADMGWECCLCFGAACNPSHRWLRLSQHDQPGIRLSVKALHQLFRGERILQWDTRTPSLQRWIHVWELSCAETTGAVNRDVYKSDMLRWVILCHILHKWTACVACTKRTVQHFHPAVREFGGFEILLRGVHHFGFK